MDIIETNNLTKIYANKYIALNGMNLRLYPKLEKEHTSQRLQEEHLYTHMSLMTRDFLQKQISLHQQQ